MKYSELLFDSVIGKAVAIGLGFMALLGWWSWSQSGQRAIGAQNKRVETEGDAHAPRVVDTATNSFRPQATQPEDSCAKSRAAAAKRIGPLIVLWAGQFWSTPCPICWRSCCWRRSGSRWLAECAVSSIVDRYRLGPRQGRGAVADGRWI